MSGILNSGQPFTEEDIAYEHWLESSTGDVMWRCTHIPTGVSVSCSASGRSANFIREALLPELRRVLFYPDQPLLEESRDGLMDKRIVVLDQEVNEEVANELIMRMFFLQDQSRKQPILLFVNSHGGGVAEGFAIMDTMQIVSPQVYTHCFGHADALAAIIVAQGAQTHRTANIESTFSLSDPWTASSSMPTPKELTEELDRVKFNLAERLASVTGGTIAQINQAMSEQTAFDASEAVGFNLIDRLAEDSPLIRLAS